MSEFIEPRKGQLLLALLKLLRAEPLTSADEGTAIEKLIVALPQQASAAAWHRTIVEAVGAGYVYDPVRLEPGSLQCRFRLELTPDGFAMIEKDLR